jgi:predicted RNA-binding Zn-ribbon protein involved in translation (DUF1610 family)
MYEPLKKQSVKRCENGSGGAFSDIACPQCRHTLLDEGHEIDGFPAVRMTVSFAMEHGWLCVSSVDGSCGLECEFDLPRRGQVNFFCPHCSAELMQAENCEKCGAPMVPAVNRDGAFKPVCSRRACRSAVAGLRAAV